MKIAKVGFVGYGYWGKNILRNLMALKNVEVVTVCDANVENLNKAATVCGPKIKLTQHYRQLLKNKDIDAIVIATPPQTHFELAMEALQAGKHVFIEKPMTTNYQEAIDLYNQSILKQKQIMVGHTFVYNPVINDLKNMIDSGELGDIHYVDFIMTNLGKYQKDNILWDLAPHGISIILHLLNNPEIERVEVNGISAIKTGLTDIAYLTLYFKNDGFANMHFSWLNPNKERKLTVVGSKKMAVFDDINPLEKLRIYNKGISEDKSFSSWGDSIVGYRHGDIVSPVTSTGEPLRNELTHFIDCILNNRKSITDGSHGAKVVKIIEEAVEKLK
jgi:predicted dehydrogenase